MSTDRSTNNKSNSNSNINRSNSNRSNSNRSNSNRSNSTRSNRIILTLAETAGACAGLYVAAIMKGAHTNGEYWLYLAAPISKNDEVPTATVHLVFKFDCH